MVAEASSKEEEKTRLTENVECGEASLAQDNPMHLALMIYLEQRIF
jgi:hypothetical protein